MIVPGLPTAMLVISTSMNPVAPSPVAPPPLAALAAIDRQLSPSPISTVTTEPPLPAASPDTLAPAGQAETRAAYDPNDIIVRGRRNDPRDPLAKVNAQSFAVTQAVDEAVVGPIARAFKEGVPEPVRDGARNILANLREPIVFLNFLLQLKPGKAMETLGRFAINSTVGVVGLFDVAKRRPFKLPRRRNGFADTLGYYGVKPGPFFFLPLIGSTTLRDVIGGGVDGLFLPTVVGKPFSDPRWTIPTGLLVALNRRNEVDERLGKIRASSDPYTAAREAYLQSRAAEIAALHGRHPGEGNYRYRATDARISPYTTPPPLPR